MTTPLYILADDLAGAHDVAVPFAKRDFAAAVLSDPDRLDRFDSADLVVLNTNTRSCGEAEAARRVGAACEAIRARNGSILYKKIDSTLRGHVGFEIELVRGLMDCGLAVCAPAFPELGRTTVGGYQLLDGVPVRGADMAGPDVPPDHALIPDLLDCGAHREMVHIDLKTLLAGSAAVRKAVGVPGKGTGKTVVADLADPQCWNTLLEAVAGIGDVPAGIGDAPAGVGEAPAGIGDAPAGIGKAPAGLEHPAPWTASTLLCGSGGMAGAVAAWLAARWKPRASPASRKPRASPASWKPRADAVSPHLDGHPVLVFACSLHDTTTRQVEELGRRASTRLCPFDPLLIVDERSRGDEVERLTSRVAEAVSSGRNAVVTPVRPGRSERREWFDRLAAAADGRDPAAVVIESLGEVARRLFTSVSPGGLVLTGGETAASVFHELECDGAWVRDEIDTGVGLAAVAGGSHDGMGVVIKPGSFGDAHTLAKAMDRLLPHARDAGGGPGSSSARDAGGGRTGQRHSPGERNGNGADDRPVIGITMGDPNGVGPEVIAKTLSQPWIYALCRPVVIGHDEVIRRALPLARSGDSEDHEREGRGPVPCPEIHLIDRPGAGRYRHGSVDVMNAAEVEIDKLNPGQVQSEAGRLAVESVKLAARLAMAGEISAVVTAPMNKEAMGLAGYAYAGHTELLGEVTGTTKYRLSLAFDGILVSHATTHVSLRDAIDRLSEQEILDTIDLVGNALAGMGVAAPRIAVCGLNPHAGEGGLFGDEEIRIIAPALEKARGRFGGRGWRLTGPLPPDTVFMRARKGDFDGIIGMYHDQGHIPVKAIAFDRTVNVTLGLPIVRTSVDHGTAFDIAGRGVADAGNLGEALRMAVKLAGEPWSVGNGPGGRSAP